MGAVTSVLSVKLLDGVSGPAKAATRSLRGISAAISGAKGGFGSVNLDPADYERARRSQEEFKQNPEGARGRALMDLQRQSDAAKSSLDAVNATPVAPVVDTSGIDEVQAKVNRLRSSIIELNAMGLRIQTSADLGPSLRALHADTGVE